MVRQRRGCTSERYQFAEAADGWLLSPHQAIDAELAFCADTARLCGVTSASAGSGARYCVVNGQSTDLQVEGSLRDHLAARRLDRRAYIIMRLGSASKILLHAAST